MAQGFTKGVPVDTDVTMAAGSNLLVPSQYAVVYAAYLSEKLGIGVDVYEKMTIPAGGLDIEALKRQDALDKLTPEEKALLGL